MANKIKYGIKNCYYAVATIQTDGSATYTTPVALPGAVSLSMEQQGDANTFYADNIAYFVSQANNGYQGDLELALIPDAFRKDVLGEVETTTGKVLIEKLNAEAKHFALLFQFEGDVNATRYCLYNCVASRSAISSTTKAESIEPQTETITITATSVFNTSISQDIVRAKTGDSTTTAVYNGWFSSVFVAAT